MKINELQVGDWVEVGGIPRQIKLIDDCINHKIIAHGVNNDGRTIAYVGKLNEEVKPILLTPEILEKNGFTYIIVLGEVAPKLENFELDNHWEGDGYSWNDIPLLYVHQLQHILRLCGIEKEITL